MTGSRDWPDQAAVVGALDEALDEAFLRGDAEFVVVHGACPTGADKMAAEWTKAQHDGPFESMVTEEAHPADWSRGRQAGPERNIKMVQSTAHLCLAFISDCTSVTCDRLLRAHPSHGASGCALLAKASGIPTRQFAPH